MIFTREMAREIATEHMKRHNVGLWDGKGMLCNDFGTRIGTYSIGSEHYEVDIDFQRDVYDGKMQWFHNCEIVDIDAGITYAFATNAGINSVMELENTIYALFSDTFPNGYE